MAQEVKPSESSPSIKDRIEAAAAQAGAEKDSSEKRKPPPPGVLLPAHLRPKYPEPEEPWSWRREWRFALLLMVLFFSILIAPLLLTIFLLKVADEGALDIVAGWLERYLPFLARALGMGAEPDYTTPNNTYDPLAGIHDDL